MNDIFNEQLVKKEANTKDMIIRAAIVAGAIAIILIVIMIPSLIAFFIPIVAVVGFGVYYLIKRTNVEYEYIITNSELDIDIIYNKSRRKRILSTDIKNFEIMASVKAYPNEYSNVDKVVDYSSGKVNENTYAAICTINGRKTKLIFEPNDQLFKSIRMFIPSKIKK